MHGDPSPPGGGHRASGLTRTSSRRDCATAGYWGSRAGGAKRPLVGDVRRCAAAREAHPQRTAAHWLLALHDVTQAPVYRERARLWWQLMKARMRARDGGRHCEWNYWDPAGPWDRRPDGTPKHWVGVHPNGHYYAIDVEGIVAAYEHGLVFKREDLDLLIATNRDFMWDGSLVGAKFRRIDGGEPDARWRATPGCLWPALLPHDATLRGVFEANHDPAGWGGLGLTPWYLHLSGPHLPD